MLNRKKCQKIQGFTWAELLVVMFVIGILSAIALPSFLKSARCCTCTPEAYQKVGTVARAQQAYFVETKQFASSISDLGDIRLSSNNYTYSIEKHKTHVFVFGKSQKTQLASYVAGVFINSKEKNTSIAIMCKAKVGIEAIASPIDANTCGSGTSSVSLK